MEKEIKLMGVTAAELRIRANADGSESRTIEGYAIVFGQESVPMWEESGLPVVETIDRGAVTEELLAKSNIRMTMYHDMGRLLARSNKGKGTLAYEIDERGVKFSFEAPHTMYGDEALELVRTGDIDGCSFMFCTRYNDPDCVERRKEADKVVYNVREITGIYDFTLTPDPAYPQTECAARSAAVIDERPETRDERPGGDTSYREQVAEMRKEAKKRIQI